MDLEVLEVKLWKKMRDFTYVYMNVAREFAQLSRCERNKIGAVIVKNGNILSFGFNGTPRGFDNQCEIGGVTRPEVIHAEANAILKCAESGMGTAGAAAYITVSPCFECAKMIIQCGITEVYFAEEYRDLSPLQFLTNCGVRWVKV